MCRYVWFFFSSRRRHTRCALLTGVQTCALPISLSMPAARVIAHDEERLLLLDEVEALLRSGTLVVDACRHVVRNAGMVISLATRPVLFALAREIGRASGRERVCQYV